MIKSGCVYMVEYAETVTNGDTALKGTVRTV